MKHYNGTSMAVCTDLLAYFLVSYLPLLNASATIVSVRVPMWQTQSAGPVRTAHISVQLTMDIVSHNPAQSSFDNIPPPNLQTITITRMLSSGGEGGWNNPINHIVEFCPFTKPSILCWWSARRFIT